LGEGKAFHVDPIVSTWPRDGILGQLTLSIRRFRALALQQLPAIKPTDPLPILPDQAKELIDSRKPVIVTVFVKANCEQGCLQQLGGELFVSLVDSELIMKLPDVINMPHVQLDVSILLVYYLLLYHGCSLEDDKSSASSDLASRLYLQCISILPQWREKAAETTMYFVGALGMSLAAMEYQDFELSWTLHSKACELAQLLGLHMLDKISSCTSSNASVERKRQGFWQLIQMDMNFRLFHNMAPTISGTDWNVNLPWLSYKPGVDGGGHPTVSTAAFIANSRLTLIGMEYTSALDKAAADPFFDLECHIDVRCNEIEATLEEWCLEDWVRRDVTLIERVLLAEALLSGYNLFIIMNSRLPCFFPTASCRHWTRAVGAARRALKVMLAVVMPKPSAASIKRMFLLRPFVAILTLFENLDMACNEELRCMDFATLNRLRNVLAAVPGNQNHLTPIIETMDCLMRRVRARVPNNV
jgi:hypothetical protein